MNNFDGQTWVAFEAAMNKTIESLLPILIKADWDMNTRGKWLEKLYEAIIEDGWGILDTSCRCGIIECKRPKA